MEIQANNILLNLRVKDQDDLLRIISQQAVCCHYTVSAKDLYISFVNREKDYSTGLQEGFAIPHAKSEAVKAAGIIYARLLSPIDWQTYDNQPVTDVFALMVPKEGAGTRHLKMLSNLATALLDENFKRKLRSLKRSDKIAHYISKEIGVDKI
uniref:PTS system, fructose-specific IIA component / PTS system, fructose-specific IIB component / PTS system, fructose-specific IIC component n=1 Tax=Loigolactobacillus rennini TaxID=238013 RepID=A0A1K2I7W5_9LACO|nr:PTS system, fructose-specific IIA component / PTS system, fructose-specific IIB component / PTS system, fructose-specific IIC component [Loigolactobacillus rennini]